MKCRDCKKEVVTDGKLFCPSCVANILFEIDSISRMLNSPDEESVLLGYNMLIVPKWFKVLRKKYGDEHCAWGHTFAELTEKMAPNDENADFWSQLNNTSTQTLKYLFFDFIKKHI